jgi:bacterioferritin
MGAVHPRVLGFLGRALSLELAAVQQYMTQASLLSLWEQSEAADLFRRETVEEMKHAERIVQRMLYLGVAPGASQLHPVETAADLEGLLRLNIGLESVLIQHYAEALRFCILIGDGENEAFFRALWSEELQHGEELARWLQQLAAGPQGQPARATF